MKVRDLMNTKLTVADPETDLATIVKMLSDESVKTVPIVDRNGKIIGIITETDVLDLLGKKEILAIKQEDVAELRRRGIEKVKEIMKTDVKTIAPDSSVDRAVFLMSFYDVNSLPVVDKNNKIIGLIRRNDILRFVSRLMTITVEKERIVEKEKITLTASPFLETDIDKIFAVIKQKGYIKFSEISKLLKVSKDTIDRWARILEDQGLVEVDYPSFGEPKMKMKK